MAATWPCSWARQNGHSADPNPIRLDKDTRRVGASDSRYQGSYSGEAEPDLETVGDGFLRNSRRSPRACIKAGFSSRAAVIRVGDYWFRSERLRPGSLDRGISHQRKAWLHAGRLLADACAAAALHANLSPGKTCAAEIGETCYPGECQGPTLQQLLEGNEPTLEKLAGSDAKFLRAVDFISKGQAQKALAPDATAFLRAAVPLILLRAAIRHGEPSKKSTIRMGCSARRAIEKAKQEKNRRPKHPHSGGKSIRLALEG